MKIVLVSLYDLRSFGVRILHALLRREGYDVTSVYFNESMTSGRYREREVELLAETIAAEQPDLIGIAVRSPLFVLFEKLARRLRRHTAAPILAGGHHPTICPEECLSAADLVCVGEGEDPLLDLCGRMSRGESIIDVPNIWLRDSGQTISNPVRPLIEDLDNIPFPDYTNTDKRYLIGGRLVREGIRADRVRRFCIQTSRGCIFRCSYCYSHTVQKICRDAGRFYRRRSPANVIEELRGLRAMFPRLESLFFSDRIFLQDEDWVSEFCERYAREIHLPFGCFGHFSTMSEEMLKAARAAGLAELTIGLQSGSEAIRRDVYNRHTSPTVIVESARLLADLGLDLYYDLISNNPYETDETHRETLELLFRMPRPYTLRLFKMRHFPATDLTGRLLSEELISPDEIESRRESAFELWASNLDARSGKTDQEVFWDSVYYMWQAGFPRAVVEAVADSAALRARPRALARALRLAVQRPARARELLSQSAGHLRRGDLRPFWDAFAKIYVGQRWGY